MDNPEEVAGWIVSPGMPWGCPICSHPWTKQNLKGVMLGPYGHEMSVGFITCECGQRFNVWDSAKGMVLTIQYLKMIDELEFVRAARKAFHMDD
jgi:hypothetical protein